MASASFAAYATSSPRGAARRLEKVDLLLHIALGDAIDQIVAEQRGIGAESIIECATLEVCLHAARASAAMGLRFDSQAGSDTDAGLLVETHHARLGGEVERHLARRTGEAKQADPARRVPRHPRADGQVIAVELRRHRTAALCDRDRRTLEGQLSVGGEDDACHVGQDVEDHRHAGVVGLRLAVPDLLVASAQVSSSSENVLSRSQSRLKTCR